jgi:putative flippase GtrA
MSRKTIQTFAKAQFSAFFGGMFDYMVMIGCTEFLHVHYAGSIIISGLMGALVNFSINRYWTFPSPDKPSYKKQLIRFYIVVLGSIALKSSGTFFLTERFLIDYKFSRLIIDLFVSVGFNFTLQKYWVFRHKDEYQTQ